MAQAITVRWENERGETLQCCPCTLSPHWFTQSEYESYLDATCCLRFVDPYGNSTFNQYQIPVLIEEIESLIQYCDDAIEQERLQCILEFFVMARGQTHTYINLIGD